VNALCVCSAKALSKYTEMVDNLIRQQKDKLEAASDEARLRLREWDMPEALQVSHTPIHYSTLHRAPSFTIALGWHGFACASLVAEAARQKLHTRVRACTCACDSECVCVSDHLMNCRETVLLLRSSQLLHSLMYAHISYYDQACCGLCVDEAGMLTL